jgi:hypothetical protein
VVKDDDSLHDAGDPVGAAAEFSQKAPALQDGYGLFAETADLGMGAVVSPLPAFEPTAPERHPDGAPGALVSLVRLALVRLIM